MWPCLISDTAPVRPTQNRVLPGPPMDGPVTQLELPGRAARAGLRHPQAVPGRGSGAGGC